MSILQKLSIITATATLISIGTVASAKPSCFYSITDLGTFGANDINNRGQLAGGSSGQAMLYSDGVITDISRLRSSDFENFAQAINDKGQVVGESETIRSGRAFLYSDGTTQDLGIDGIPYDINNRGQIVGGSQGGAFLYSGGTTTIINTDGVAFGINNRGQVVGYSDHPNRAFLYENGTTNYLSNLPGYDSSSARTINDKGQVVGVSFNSVIPPDYRGSAFLYNRSTGMIDLGKLRPSDIFTSPTDINNRGQVVGFSGNSFTSGNRAFLYSDGKLQDLNNLIDHNSGFTLTEASAINNRGQIVGSGLINGQSHGYLLTPVQDRYRANASCQ